MHSKWTRLVAAAAAVMVVFFAIGHLGGKKNIVFADVCRGVNRSKTITYSIRSVMSNTPDLVCRVMEKDGIGRIEFLGIGQYESVGDVWIVDREHGKCLCLDTTRKVGWYSGSKMRHAEETSIYDTFRNFLEIPGIAIKNLGMRQVAGHPAIGFQLTKQVSGFGPMEYTVWADSDTKLPILIECKLPPLDSREILHVITDIVFDEPLDDSLFDFNPPGFKIETPEPDPKVARMQCAVKMDTILKACRQYINDHNGQWPDAMSSELQSYGVNPETWVNPRR